MSRFGDYAHLLWHLTHPHKSCGSEPEQAEISDAALCRQMLYDSFDDPEAVAELAGLPAISPDVAQMEHRAHHERMDAIAPMLPLLVGQAEFMGATAAMLQCRNAEDDENLEAVTTVFTHVVRASVIASVSSAVAMGVLEVRKGVVSSE